MSQPEGEEEKRLSKANVLMIGTGYVSSLLVFVFAVFFIPHRTMNFPHTV